VLTAFVVIGGLVGDLDIIPDRSEVETERLGNQQKRLDLT